jgi:hypothetical protein
MAYGAVQVYTGPWGKDTGRMLTQGRERLSKTRDWDCKESAEARL